ncbi:RNA polymerase sigma factor [Amycolatopsis jejuensis]|uniref:RNA polymerase sigma factor n=1 Tax=Amycolatopsis jejuensis TaxID=330084 RepID=UPI000524C0F0|nr:sigma-70 family RNA polymerase sigma factor [Amycolatopsis jejuensis]
MPDEDEVRRLSARMVGIVGANAGLRGDADDACQSAWVDFLARPPALRDETRLAGWLTTVARRHALREADRRTRVVTGDVPEDARELEDSPEEHTLTGELAAALWRAVATFPERHRRMMVLLAYYPELRRHELAAELGISPASVAKTRQRCLEALRRKLESQGFSYP